MTQTLVVRLQVKTPYGTYTDVTNGVANYNASSNDITAISIYMTAISIYMTASSNDITTSSHYFSYYKHICIFQSFIP